MKRKEFQKNLTDRQKTSIVSDLRTEREAGEYLNLSVRTLQKFRFEGRGPAYHKFGGAIRYHLDDLETYITSRRINPDKAA